MACGLVKALIMSMTIKAGRSPKPILRPKPRSLKNSSSLCVFGSGILRSQAQSDQAIARRAEIEAADAPAIAPRPETDESLSFGRIRREVAGVGLVFFRRFG